MALGAAVGVAVMGRRTAVWKAAAWGAVGGTLPDLDALIDYGNPVLNMTLHRADSHALFWLTLAGPLLGAAIARLHGEWAQVRHWMLALWLVLVTHPLLDLMTVYGTQLARPFSSQPYGVGSIFIIDPLYTLPLIVGVIAALRLRQRAPQRGLRWNQAGLALSTAYLAWGVAAQQQVSTVARTALAAQGVEVQHLLVTPAPFNTVLWRVVAMTPDGYLEGFRSLLDSDQGGQPQIRFDRFERGAELHAALSTHDPVERIAAFSRGFWRMREVDGRVAISDLRMGQDPVYTFAFAVAERRDGVLQPLAQPVAVGRRPADIGASLRWLWRRMLGERLTPPR